MAKKKKGKGKGRGYDTLCESLKLIHDANDGSPEAQTIADRAKADAKKWGCGWAK